MKQITKSFSAIFTSFARIFANFGCAIHFFLSQVWLSQLLHNQN